MKFVGLVMAFFILLILGYLGIGFMATQTAPDSVNNTAARAIYDNQSATIEIAYSGYDGALLLLILAIVLGAAWLIIKAVN
jgi:Na+-transporting methylmalonyl-CoA/oxaloacetate decarboxylase gamma subunit